MRSRRKSYVGVATWAFPCQRQTKKEKIFHKTLDLKLKLSFA